MKKFLLAAVLFAVPALASAQIDTGNLDETVMNVTDTVNLIIPLMLAVAVIVFIYGVIKYILAQGEITRKAAVDRIVWSVVAIASILAVWGLARLLIDVFNLDPQQLQRNEIPTVAPRPVVPR
jgi:uncharacterized membrane protein YidH (DUF202 family)